MSELKPWGIRYFRSGGFINKDYDMARIYKDLPIIEGKMLLKELNTRPDLKARLVEEINKLPVEMFDKHHGHLKPYVRHDYLMSVINTIMGEQE